MSKIYEPREDSFLLLNYIKKYANGLVLDIGCGSGILGLEASKYADFVYLCDVNALAIEEGKENYEGKIDNIKFVKSDLFSAFKFEKFNLIIFNPPYLPLHPLEDSESALINSGGLHGWELIEKFVSSAGKYLVADTGKILILFSSLTGKDKCESIFSENGYKFKCLKEKKMGDGEVLYVYLLG